MNKKHEIKNKNMMELAEYQKELCKKPSLKFLFLELTDCCNLHCEHCGSNCNSLNATYLDYNIIEQTLNKVACRYDPTHIMICITGGEPVLHSRLSDVIRLSKRLGFSVGMTSNGTLIDESKASNLVDSGLDTVAISIDGIGEQHDIFRKTNDSFNRSIAGIKAFKKSGIEPQVITVVHKGNIDSLDDMYNYFNKLDICSWRIVNVDPIGRAKANQKLLLEGIELRYLFDFIRSKRFSKHNTMNVSYGCSHFVTYDYENEIRDYYFQCGAGLQVGSIMANGDIGACLDIERNRKTIQGNIYENDFIGIWENRYSIFREDRTKNSKKCSICSMKEVCRGDSAHTWDFSSNEPLYCVKNIIDEEIGNEGKK